MRTNLVLPHSAPERQLAVEISRLKDEAVDLLILANDLRKDIEATLAKIDPPAPGRAELRQIVLDYLRTASNRQVREDLITARGPASAATLRTKLSSDLEQRRGQRHPASAGRAVIYANGNGAHAA